MHAELSAHYHRYSTDFYLLALNVARITGDAARTSNFAHAALRQSRALRLLADDNGRLPLIGDDDGGQLFPICGRPVIDCTDTLATAAVLLDEPSLALAEPPEETWWMCAGNVDTGTTPRRSSGRFGPRHCRRAATTSLATASVITWSSTAAHTVSSTAVTRMPTR